MDNLKTALGIILVIAIGWHIKVGFSSDTKISGIFQAKPETGYNWEKISSNIGGLGLTFDINEESKFPVIQAVTSGGPAQQNGLQLNDFIIKINGLSTNSWTRQQILNAIAGEIGTICNLTIWRSAKEFEVNCTRGRISYLDDNIRLNTAYNPTSHFFWEDNKVIWCTGFVHPKFNVQAAETKNTWVALPGYVLTGTKDGDFSTMWKQGLSHPYMNAYSANIEGRWIADLGYKFITENGLAIGTTWASGTKYPEYKLIASDKAGVFNAYPGYTFPNPTKSLDVAWTPGLTDPNNPNRISGTLEGDWIDKPVYTESEPTSTEPTWGDHLAVSAATAGLANFGEWLFGKNFISNELNKKSDEELIKSAVKGYKKLTE